MINLIKKIKDHAKVCALCKMLILFIIGGLIYVGIELSWRGYSHWTMFIVGGLCFIMIGSINEYISFDMPILYQSIIASLIITLLEFICGYIVNIKLGWNVWDYSNMPLNVCGQICLLFSLIWMVIGLVAIVIDDYLRFLLFDEEIPHYKWK